MSENKHLMGFYGTLRKGFHNNRLVGNSKYVGQGLTEKKYTMYARGIPYVVKDIPTSKIILDIYEVNDNTLRNLDSLEGHPRWYCREEAPVNINGEIKNVWIYFMPNTPNLSQLPILTTGDFNEKY